MCEISCGYNGRTPDLRVTRVIRAGSHFNTSDLRVSPRCRMSCVKMLPDILNAREIALDFSIRMRAGN